MIVNVFRDVAKADGVTIGTRARVELRTICETSVARLKRLSARFDERIIERGGNAEL